MKKNKTRRILDRILKTKVLIMMRLLVFFFFASTFSLIASGTYSQNKTITMNKENVLIKDVLSAIEDQCGYFFIYNNEFVDVYKRINVQAENKEVSKLLEEVFSDQQVSYQINERRIILKANANVAYAQKAIKVTGKVADTSGAPLPGVTVVVKGTTNGTITNFDGVYSLSDVPPDATIQFSFVGMKMQEIVVGGKSSIDVVMEEDAIGIEEVVAIGYGSIRRKDLTGSVASVSGNTLKDVPVTSAAQAIAGRLAGVQVTKTEGSPDASIKIRIRGGGSITQDNSPLFIVDGFPVDNIDDVAPTDIESIDVLKDASSTAIYGARGANGVILITTKGGFDGKGKVKYNSYVGIKKVTKTLDVLNPYEFVLYQYDRQSFYDRRPTSKMEKYFGAFDDFDIYKQMNGTNWQDEIFGQTGTSMYHNLSFSGGSKTSKYNVSLTHSNDKEVMIGSGYKKTNLTIKTNHKLTKWLTLDLNTRLYDGYLKGAGTSRNSRLYHAIQFRPVNGLADYVDFLLTDEDFEAGTNNVLNPLKQTLDDYRRTKSRSSNFNGALNIQLAKNLKFRFEAGTSFSESGEKRFYGLNTSNVINSGRQPIASISKSSSTEKRMANVLTYRKKNFLPGSTITAMVGEELIITMRERISVTAKYFPKYIDAASAFGMMNLGTANPITTYDYPEDKTSSFFGRVNYDYKKRYLLSASLRADGSSKFAPGNQWGYFPSAAFAWRLSDEKFMKASKSWLNDMKLRVSYGESGNNRISDDAWRKTFSTGYHGLTIGGDGETAVATTYIKPNSILSNPKLKWETTVTRNLGLDFVLWDQHISGSVEAYKNTTRDLLIRATIPSNTGYTTQWQNIGQTSNQGIEIVLNAILVQKNDFNISASFNIAFNQNKIDKLGDTKSWEQTSGWVSSGGPSGDYFIEEGGQVGQMYGYVTEGMYAIDDFDYADGNYTLKEGVSDNSSIIGGGSTFPFMPGALKLQDLDGDGIVDTNDRTVVGNANPKHTGGFNLTLQYKGFDFSTFFNWVYGNDIYNANKLYSSMAVANYSFKNVLDIMNSSNRFTYVDPLSGALVKDPVELAELNKNATIWSPLMSITPLHSWGIEDGSFLRLNNITLGYTLPKSLMSKLNISQLRIYATAYNLWTWTNYSGFDPEVDMIRSTPLTPGIDWCAYPRSRSFNVGINVEF